MTGSTTETDEPKAKWWIWMPLGAAVAFGVYGLAIYDYEIHASNARKICEALKASGTAAQSECDKRDRDYGKALSLHILDRISNSTLKTTP